ALLPSGDGETEEVPVRGAVEMERVPAVRLTAVEHRVRVAAQGDGGLRAARGPGDELALVGARRQTDHVSGPSLLEGAVQPGGVLDGRRRLRALRGPLGLVRGRGGVRVGCRRGLGAAAIGTVAAV